MNQQRKGLFYGWYMVLVGHICYGFGVSPGYYSWGFYAPEVVKPLEEGGLGLSKEQIGDVFGIFSLIMSGMALVAGPTISRLGLRVVISVGALVAAAGFFLLSDWPKFRSASSGRFRLAPSSDYMHVLVFPAKFSY